MERQEILDAFRDLPVHRRHDAMRVACTYALEVWERFAKGGPIEYSDGIVGQSHVVDMQLPVCALAAIDRKLAGDPVDPTEIWNAYLEPSVAMRDGDLDFPDDIAAAYNAIYNLFGLLFRKLKLYDDETIIRQAYSGEGFIEEWWTRTWDAWASRPEVRYAPSELDGATFDALANGDIAQALATSAPTTLVHAVLLALDGRAASAARLAAEVLGVDNDAWLRRNVAYAAASDAIATSRDGKRYAAIFGNRYIVRDVGTHAMRLSGRTGFDLRRIAFSASNDILILAGDESDRIGAYQTILAGEVFNSRDYGYRKEILGTRQIVAVSPAVDVVGAGDRITGAAFDAGGDYLVTYAGETFSLTRCADGACLLTKTVGGDIWHAMLADGRLLVAVRGQRAHVVGLPP